jgi:hypothetical protein
MEELGSALGRFVGGLSDVDELRGVFRDYLRRHPNEREAVAQWLGESIQIGRISPAVMLTVRDLLTTSATLAGRTDAAAPADAAQPRPRPPLQRSGGAAPVRPEAARADSATRLTRRASAAPSSDGVVAIGSVLDERYTLMDLLGSGGMGTVYRARDRNREDFRDRNPFIALKVLSEEFKRHPDARMALQRETARAQSLAHPNIITVFDFDYDGPNAYMTMELLEGQPLDALLQNPGFAATPFEQRWHMVRGIGQGLAYAHEKSVVHSDLKPGNIFVCKNGVVKVMDFGIARPLRAVADQSKTETTAFGDPAERLGGLTPAYAALEQWNRDPPDPRDDIYAYACVVYYLFSGQHPFARASAKTASERRLVPARVKSLTARQWDALKRGLAFQRSDRIASIDEFLRRFAPQTTLQRYRLWITGATLVALGLLLFFAAKAYREYSDDQAQNAMLWPGVEAGTAALTPEQHQELDDVIYLVKEAVAQARRAQTADEFIAIMSKGANNVHEMLSSVRSMDPGNSQAVQLTGEAAQAYGDRARMELAANRLDGALQLVNEGQRFEHTRELLRLRQTICRRSPAVCANSD